jgi:hypothetical protein
MAGLRGKITVGSWNGMIGCQSIRVIRVGAHKTISQDKLLPKPELLRMVAILIMIALV